jgi:hypothetical protein
MAKKGNYAAFQNLQPTQGLSRDIQFWNNDAANRRQEDRINNQMQFQRDESAKKAKRDFYDKNIKPLNYHDTGSSSLNEAEARLLTSATSEYLPLLQTLENSDPSSDAYIKAKLGLANLQQLPEKLLAFTKAGTQEHNAYLEGVKTKNIWGDLKYEKRYQEGWKGIQLGYDENFNPVGAFVDNDNDGVLDVVSFEQYQSGQASFTPVTRHNFETIAKTVAADAGTMAKKKITEDGFGTEETEGIKKEFVTLAADRMFTVDGEGKFSSYAISAFIESGIPLEEATEDDMLKVKNAFIKDVDLRSNTRKENTIDNSGRTSAAKEARLSGEGGSTVKFTEAVTPSKAVWGSTNFAPGAYSVGFTGSGVVLDAVRDGDNVITNATVKNSTYDIDDNLVIDISYQDVKSSAFKREEISGLEKIIKTLEEEKNPDDNETTTKKIDAEIEKFNLQLDRISTGAQNKRKIVTVPIEDKSEVASYFGGIEELEKRIFPDGRLEEEETKVDEYGVLIN